MGVEVRLLRRAPRNYGRWNAGGKGNRGAVAVLKNEEAQRRFGISSDEIAELEAAADAYDEGVWPRGRITRVDKLSPRDEGEKPEHVPLSPQCVESVQ